MLKKEILNEIQKIPPEKLATLYELIHEFRLNLLENEIKKDKKIKIEELIGCTGYRGKAKTIEEMDEGIRQAIIKKWGNKKHDRD